MEKGNEVKVFNGTFESYLQELSKKGRGLAGFRFCVLTDHGSNKDVDGIIDEITGIGYILKPGEKRMLLDAQKEIGLKIN